MTGDRDTSSPAIVVLGDWVLDEYLFLRPHQSDISSYTSSSHYKISEGLDKSVERLCGAAHIARRLVELSENIDCATFKKPRIFGLGNWASAHQNEMHELVTSGAKSIATSNPKDHADSSQFHLHQIPPNRTLKVRRRYEVTTNGARQLSRDDIVINEPECDANPDLKSALNLFLERISNHNITAVIVFDLNKGAVTPELIAHLYKNKKFRNAKWFIRSKQPAPTWFKKLRTEPDLLVIGPEVLAFDNPTGQWLSYKNEIGDPVPRISRQTNELFESYYEPRKSPDHPLISRVLKPKLLLLITANRDIIGIHNHNLKYFTKRTFIESNDVSTIGWSSRLIASLAFDASVNDKNLSLDNIHTGVDVARQTELDFDHISTSASPRMTQLPYSWAEENSWAEEKVRWNNALDPDCLGIIPSKSEKNKRISGRLELWRSMTDIPGYICCVNQKRKVLLKISRLLLNYRGQGMRGKSLSIWLRSDPGAGKTALARRLATLFDYGFIETSINNLVRTEEIIDFFDAVSTVQAREYKPILVFVDEINATVENQPVYRSFLSVLDSLKYERRGRVFVLQPCVWLFAGTTVDIDDRPAETKIRDFDDRITYADGIDLASLEQKVGTEQKRELHREARLEQVYLGALMIREHFPGVRYISRALLKKFFNDVPPVDDDTKRSGSRTLAKQVSLLRNIDGDTVRLSDWTTSVDQNASVSKVKVDDSVVELID